MAELLQVGRIERLVPSKERANLERRARLLAWGGIAWHFIEFGIALGAGIAAGSIALIGFGADSLIESLAGFVVLWLFTGSRLHSETGRTSRTASHRDQLLRPRRLCQRRGDPNPRRRRAPRDELGWRRPGRLHRSDDAPAC